MTLVAFQQGLLWPFSNLSNATSGSTIDAAGEKAAFVGYCYIDGEPGSAKTLSAAGGGSIAFRLGTTTFANVGTTFDIGLQDVDVTTGPIVRPDEIFDVKVTLTGGGGGLTTAAWNTVAMTGGAGSKSVTHGDLIAIVFDMTARGGTDSVFVNASNPSPFSTTSWQPFLSKIGGVWANVSSTACNAVIHFDDGTLATIEGGFPGLSTTDVTTMSFSDSSNPDEYGLLFQVPFDCKVNALWAYARSDSSAADFDVKLYSDPLGTPSVIATKSIVAEQGPGATSHGLLIIPMAAPISLSKGVNYCISVKAASTGTVRLQNQVLGSANYRTFFPGGTTLGRTSRNNSTGAFAAATTTSLPVVGVRISHVDDGTGAGRPTYLLGI